MTLLALTNSACDALLGLYGTTPVPHRGRDRLVSFLSKRARNRWNGVRLMHRRGLVMESDLSVDDVGWTLYAYGCLDYWDERAIRGMLTPGCFCIDIGAHIGYYSLLLSKWVGQTGRVFSYEPVPYTYSFLERNLQHNATSNVKAEQAAAGSRNGVVRMAFPNGGRLGWSTVSDSGDVDVRCTTIDSEVSRLALDRVDFVKIDTEGYEPQVLAGAERTIQQMRPKIMFEVNRNALERHDVSPARVRDFFLSHNYELFTAERRGLSLITDLSQGPSYFNVFALPNSNEIRRGKPVVEECSGEDS
jgi:FkbM family methyltransferase